MTHPNVQPVTRIFTFGSDHACPVTGANLANRYVTVTAPDYEQCRALMWKVYDRNWCADYSGVDDPRLRGHGSRLVEHGRLSVAVPPVGWRDDATGLVSGGLVPSCPTCGGDHHTVEPCR